MNRAFGNTIYISFIGIICSKKNLRMPTPKIRALYMTWIGSSITVGGLGYQNPLVAVN